MKNSSKLSVLILSGVLVISCFKIETRSIIGWGKYVDVHEDSVYYNIGLDQKIFYDGTQSAYLKSQNASEDDFGSLMQSCWAKDYLGQKIKFSAFLKTAEVSNWAGLWFRVDDIDNNTLRFKNMELTPIKGNQEWQEYSIIMEVPNNSASLNFGVLLYENGTVWMDGVKFEGLGSLSADSSVAIKFDHSIKGLKNAINLNFEE